MNVAQYAAHQPEVRQLGQLHLKTSNSWCTCSTGLGLVGYHILQLPGWTIYASKSSTNTGGAHLP